MIKGVILKKLDKFEDERGWLSEVFRQDEIDYQPAMAYVSLTKPGIIRGPHEHLHQADCFIFAGPGNFSVHLWDRRPGSETEAEYMHLQAGKDNPTMLIVPPGVVHGYKSIGNEDAYSINLPDRLYKGAGKSDEIDEIRWEKDPASPYKIN